VVDGQTSQDHAWSGGTAQAVTNIPWYCST